MESGSLLLSININLLIIHLSDLIEKIFIMNYQLMECFIHVCNISNIVNSSLVTNINLSWIDALASLLNKVFFALIDICFISNIHV